MKMLYFIKDEPDATVKAVMDEHKKTNEVEVVDIRKDKNYDEIVDRIAKSEKVVSV